MKKLPEITVVNHHHLSKEDHQGTEYIGRGSPLGNPYSHMDGTTAQHKVESREAAVAAYRPWLEAQIGDGNDAVIEELDRLAALAMEQGFLNLRCYCSPAPCHGEIIRDVLLEAISSAT